MSRGQEGDTSGHDSLRNRQARNPVRSALVATRTLVSRASGGRQGRQTNRIPEQRRVIQQAKANGLNVLLGSGGPLREHYEAAGGGRMSFNGVLHAKVLLVERDHQGQTQVEWLGESVNWTTDHGF